MNIHDDLLDALNDQAPRHALSCFRGPEGDERLYFIRQDGGVWSESSIATRVGELTDAELELSEGRLIEAPLGSPEWSDELAYWRAVPGLAQWIQGGPHPWTIAAGRAMPIRRGSLRPQRELQRVRVGSAEYLAPTIAAERLRSQSDERQKALADPEHYFRAFAAELRASWREASFSKPIAFSQDSLAPIRAETILALRRHGAGLWIFEHPESEAWICCLPESFGAPVSDNILHNGQEPLILSRDHELFEP